MDFLTEALWPTTVLVLALLFKNEFRGIVRRVEKAKFPGGAEFGFGKTAVDMKKLKTETDIKIPDEKLISTRTGSIYWLAYDIMYTVDIVLRSAPNNKVLKGIIQAQHHMERIGYGETDLNKRLKQILNKVQQLQNEFWNQGMRNVIASDLNEIAVELGEIIQSSDPDFKAGPYYE